MVTSSNPASKVRAMLRSAIEVQNKKVDPSCTECTDIPAVRAVILYPNLGTPLIVPPGEKKLNIFIAAEAKSKELFLVRKTTPNDFPSPAFLGYMYVDKHLRIYPISEKKPKEDTKEGRLWNDGRVCSSAFEHVKVWCVGRMRGGVIKDIDGNIVANIRQGTLDQYNGIRPAHPDTKDPLSENPGLAWIYQVQIDLDNIPHKPGPGEQATLAWMVSMPQAYKKQKALTGLSDWEYQDKLIYDFLEAQKKSPQHAHFPDLYEFDLSKNAIPIKLPAQTKTISHRLKAWHPISIGTRKKLSIGHLSDVHINSRHYALAKSTTQVIEGNSATLGPKLDISFAALKSLFDEMKKAGADVLFITGDLLDFNRNIDPNQVGASVADQWTKFNVAKNIRDASLYKRGIDDMLMFSLLRYSYKVLKMPVFVTTGNHEAYDVPYGISPRKNTKVATTGVAEMMNILKGPHGDRQPDTKVELNSSMWDLVKAGVGALYKNSDINSYTHGKANEGVPADHNLTVYEACLMYGPSYAQALTSQNFTTANYDWFFTLFTPLADYVIDYKQQVLIGLDWGSAENYINLQSFTDGKDDQGIGILPRAVESISAGQKSLLESAFRIKQNPGGSKLLFSHFTFINFNMGVPLRKNNKINVVKHKVAQFNDYNVGTCEKEQKWLFEKCVNININYHFSGHSHRSAVYKVSRKGKEEKRYIVPMRGPAAEVVSDFRSVSGFDPLIEPNHPDNAAGINNITRLIVSSCGGPIGVQNYDNELYAFNMQVPSGTLLNEDATPPIKVVKADVSKAAFTKPRLCVALDYLWVIWEMSDQKQGEEPIQFHNPRQIQAKPPSGSLPDSFAVRLGAKINALDCIAEINFWVYIDTGSIGWNKISMKLDKKMPDIWAGRNYQYALIFDGNGKARLDEMLSKISRKDKPMMFCEVGLKAAHGVAVKHYNWEDKWIFPVSIVKSAASHWMIARRRGQSGEIPDWKMLNKMYPGKYPKDSDVTSNK
ncbi:metallophosphoesterase [Janthinobacterium agaricidamnosum]|uniref:Calcineurin-like phosphoesterase family protein n=1 Tax=Janthinobacterium agaricidamnosum NBRC 102515 = DSM 9628 TaxID=1349767 RepID=W0VAG7_9BURK|nr:metallophosphoesterase [Janthinobacterium agaricidamnosum]CDG84353.1 calcineurin-like phosphoesterase family protein [Janthinobacterium agaricidamnosum NBRC 102515 = DSM 9628]